MSGRQITPVTVGAKNFSPLLFQRLWPPLGFLDVITIQGCRGLEQGFAKMRIAALAEGAPLAVRPDLMKNGIKPLDYIRSKT
ncbi:MAG: hypothetical protein EYR95_09030 [Phormidium sp. SL48-SHIP]|nr:MAG: hypothetical protein EYR95_09030 [Phormidium sp. SL48-SHIP]